MTDRYTKAVLTMIAAALVGIFIQNAVGQLNAQGAMMQICGSNPESTGATACATMKLLGTSTFGRPVYGLQVSSQ